LLKVKIETQSTPATPLSPATIQKQPRFDYIDFPTINLAKNTLELQFDVSMILATLIKTVWKNNGKNLPKGIMGPQVLHGRDGRERLRIISWDGQVVTLIPESYLRKKFKKKYHKTPSHTRAMGYIETSITLWKTNNIPVDFGAMNSTEADTWREEMGPRIWTLATPMASASAESDKTILTSASHTHDTLCGLLVEWCVFDSKNATIVTTPMQKTREIKI
jgi:hypothetical protein